MRHTEQLSILSVNAGPRVLKLADSVHWHVANHLVAFCLPEVDGGADCFEALETEQGKLVFELFCDAPVVDDDERLCGVGLSGAPRCFGWTQKVGKSCCNDRLRDHWVSSQGCWLALRCRH